MFPVLHQTTQNISAKRLIYYILYRNIHMIIKIKLVYLFSIVLKAKPESQNVNVSLESTQGGLPHAAACPLPIQIAGL